MDAWRAGLQEDGLLLSQASIDDSHRELAVKVGKGSYTSNEEVYLILFCVISEQALDSDDLNFVAILLSYLLQEPLSMLNWKDRSRQNEKMRMNKVVYKKQQEGSGTYFFAVLQAMPT